MKRHFHIFLLITQHVLNYRTRNLVWFIEAMINPLILMLFWQGALISGVKINDWTINDIRSYYLYLLISTVFLMHSVEILMSKNEIKNGELVPHLLRPFPYSLFRFYMEAPWRFIQLFYGLVTIILLAILFDVKLTFVTDPIMFTLAVIIAVAAYILSYLFKMVISFIAFWLIDIHSILEVNELLILMLAGHILPIPFFPHWMQIIANITPYPYIIYYPATAFIGLLNTSELIKIIGIQSLWICLFTILYVFLWRKGLKVFTGVGQ